MNSILLPVTVELGAASEPWPDDAKLFQQFQMEQILLPEMANSLAVQAFLKMCGLNFEVVMRANAEQMSPSGQLPFIKCGAFVISEMEPIVGFVNTKGIQLSEHLNAAERADMRAYMSLVNNVLLSAEVTFPRYTFCYPWPLNHILCWKKKKSVKRKLCSVDWGDKTLNEVYQAVENCCQALSERLQSQEYFFGDRPTELDALVFGHVSAILSNPLPDNRLADIISEHSKLVSLWERITNTYFRSKIGL